MPLIKKVLIVLSVCLLCLLGCQSEQADPNTLRVGAIAGPEVELLETAKTELENNTPYKLKIIEFQDYATPNIALNDGLLEANMFQTKPFFDEMVRARGYKLIPIAKTFVFPMGVYSKAVKNIDDLPKKSKVAIPNDPSNSARALLILQDAGLIQIDPQKGLAITEKDIIDNPRELKFLQLDAAQLPRVLNDVGIAIINTNYAVAAGMMPTKEAILLENKDSPYANILVIHQRSEDDPRLKALVKALNSPAVASKAEQTFKGQAIPAW